jgi:hypothetical protein
MWKIGWLGLVAVMLEGAEMIQVRKSEERGVGEYDWLKTHYTFSFADYFDEDFMGFRELRVINEDVVDPKKGFDTHPHKDMEILTYIIDGALEHKDNLGNHYQIKKGEFQIQSAGTGITHSEHNPSKKEPVHLLQIWIRPEKNGLQPGYRQKSFADHAHGLKLVVSPEGKEGALQIHQDAKIYLGRLDEGEEAELALGKDRYGWVQVIEGEIDCNGVTLSKGDGASISQEKNLAFEAHEEAEFLIFDLK